MDQLQDCSGRSKQHGGECARSRVSATETAVGSSAADENRPGGYAVTEHQGKPAVLWVCIKKMKNGPLKMGRNQGGFSLHGDFTLGCLKFKRKFWAGVCHLPVIQSQRGTQEGDTGKVENPDFKLCAPLTWLSRQRPLAPAPDNLRPSPATHTVVLRPPHMYPSMHTCTHTQPINV